ncbi:MAG: serine/threonine-protein kinase [Methylococcales bacterium]|nr:serine/threonine-protein kinase [Methylococcales bacterium]
MSEKSHTDSNDTDVTHVKNDMDVTLVQSVDPNEEQTILNSNPSANSSTEQTTNERRVQSSTSVSSYSNTGSFPATPLEIGSVVKNTYELVQVLGEGGMGSVFKALNKDWEEVGARDPYVALKVLKPELSGNKELVMGLFREFDRIKMLSDCPNNIKVHDFGRDGANVFMTMEYLTGQTLSEYINRQPTTLAHAWFIIEGVGNALAFAHEHNIVHRDIKPGNIFITEKGVVKVLDFGIASKINENEDDRTKFNGDDLGAFTLAYASPDTRLGDPPDCRDDIYSFACVIYEILTGKKFFDPKRRSKKAEPIHGLNSKQMDALNKALAFERDLRTPNIRELLDKLRPVKTPWLKYGSIGGGVILIIVLVLLVKPLLTDEQDTVVIPPKQDTVVIPPKQDTVVIPPKQDTVVIPPKQDTVVIPPKQDTPFQFGTSSDGVIQLQTSKPEYKNGESFRLSFTLTQPSYVRVIDRDTKDEVTTLRPNPRQPDKLLPANKEQVFPPKDIDLPIEGGSGNGTITVIASSQAFSAMELLNADGSISEQVKNGAYSWVQVRYKLR